MAVIKNHSKKRRLKNAMNRLLSSSSSKQAKKTELSSLHALTSAALLLPGLLATPAHAADGDEVDFQYGHYQESKRTLYGNFFDFETGANYIQGIKQDLQPIEVDTIKGHANFALSDRVKFAFNYLQDTWGGATPIASAPAAFGVIQPRYSAKDSANVTRQTIPVGATPYLQGGAGIIPGVDAQGRPLVFTGSDPVTGESIYQPNSQMTNIMTSASPEVRNQGDFKLTYEFDDAAISAGGGISSERDYESHFGNIGGLLNFNQKRTTLNLGLSYTNSNTHAVMNHDSFTYVDSSYYKENGQLTRDDSRANAQILSGIRQDWGTTLGISQVLNKDALISGDLSYTRSSGYLANPYKAVSTFFVDPDPNNQFIPGLLTGQLAAIMEQRPNLRNQWNLGARYVQHIAPLDAALHFDYHFSTDDWGIQGHTFEADWVQPLGNGWTITPRIRYYSQDNAKFYTPYMTTNQAFSTTLPVTDPVRGQVYTTGGDQTFFQDPNLATAVVDTVVTQEPQFDPVTGDLIIDGNGDPILVDTITSQPVLDANGNPTYADSAGNPVFVDPNLGVAVVDANGTVVADPTIISNLTPKTVTNPYDRSKLPANFSSDHRLAGFGALSGGVTVSKEFAKGLTLETGFEYYTHQSSLKMGGGGINDFNNYDSWNVNANLKVNLQTLALARSSGDNPHSSHHHDHGVHAPAGVMFDHMLPKAGDFMVGYRYMYGSQSGSTLNGTKSVSDAAIVAGGCGPNPCFLRASNMSMNMHMLDLMYAPTDWLTLMLMPQFVDMSMSMTGLNGVPPGATPNNNVGNPVDEFGNPVVDVAQHLTHHTQNEHQNGGIGDLGMYSLFKLFDNGTHHVHVTAGLSAPTGNVTGQFNRNHKVDGGFMDYGMQLGSGTWDFKPSLTYTGKWQQVSWGAQANGTVRMQSHNDAGYSLGDIFQTTFWGNYNFTNWLTASIRGVYTTQGAIKNEYIGGAPAIHQFSPVDYTSNYGGKYWDVGFGLSAVVPSGDLAGNRVSVEWLQPVQDNVNGYQLERDGSLSATWSVAF